MSISVTVNQTVTRGGESVSVTQTLTGEGWEEREIAVAGAASNLQVALTLDISALSVLVFSSDQDLTIETNSTSDPGDTLTLLAGKPLVWIAGSGVDLPLSVDVTTLYVTNDSDDDTDATLRIRALFDATP